MTDYSWIPGMELEGEVELATYRSFAPILDCPVCGTPAKYGNTPAVGVVKFPDEVFVYHECPRCHHVWVPKEAE